MTAEMDPRLEEALAAASAAPEDEGRWDELEELAESLQRPDEVGALYREALGRTLPADVAERLGRRAVGFHEEWFGEESPHLVDVLTRVLSLDPGADWALQRATVVLTVRERWTDLLGLYDRALAAASEDWRRTQLLEEASQLAKDFAGQPDRAIDYQTQLLALRPGDAQLVASLERLLERQARWQELIGLWRKRIEGGADDAASLRERIATTFLDHLGDAAATLAESRALIEGGHSIAHAVALLERVLILESASADVRRGALALLRERYESDGKDAEVERILSIALGFGTRDEKIAIHRELGERTATRGDESSSMGHWASLLLLDPGAEDAEQRLRQLAASTGAHERHADALVAAAEAAYEPARRMTLLLEAGDVRGMAVGDRETAEPLYRRVLGDADASESFQRTAARRLVALLDDAERARDRLDVLEQLAKLENDASERRRVIGQAARLAEELGASDRALALWQARLDADAQDLEALDARIGILEREERWQPLIETLRLRAASPVPGPLQRADLVRLAGVQAERVGDRAGAIETWLEVQSRFGEDVETVDALFRLFTAESRWEEMAAMLERAVRRDEARAADIVVRLADVRREHLADSARAAQGYHQALKLEPRHEGARAGLQALITDPVAKAGAVEGLAEAALRTDDHEALLGLLEHRIEAAAGDRVRVRLLREAAELEESRRSDALAAMRAIRRAFLLVPDDEGLEGELMRLGRASGGWAEVVSALREAIPTVSADAARAAHLHRRAATLLESELGDAPGALSEQLAAFTRDARDGTTAREVVRLGAQLGAWDAVATALVGSVRAHRRIDDALVTQIEAAADQTVAWDALSTETASAMARVQGELEASGERRFGELGRAIETRIAVWHRDRRGDLSSAEAALARALKHEPGHTDTLRELARLQWREPSRALVDTLLSLSEQLEDDLDALHDAAKIALDPVRDVALAKHILGKLYRESVRLWERGNRTRGERPADKTAVWALDELIRIELESDRVEGAIDLLAQGARLPIPATESRAMRRRAGDLAREKLGDEARAMRLYQSIADESLEDAETVDRLAAMYEARKRIPELLALRQRELEGTLTAERRLAVRLDVARLLGRLEAEGGRIEMLRANLSEKPGHDASIDEVASVLESKGRSAELADLLTTQARDVEVADAPRGARLWSMVARLAEERLRDAERAISAHRRVVALDVTTDALDALARLHLERNEAAQAGEWLEKRLEHAKGAERIPLALRLAEARLLAGRNDRAMHALERALSEDRGARDVRERLADLYRRAESWEQLAALLSDGVGHVSDETTQLAFVREAAEIYRKRLDRPELAIPIMERGVQLAPDDQELRSTLAAGLRVAGRLDEAREILEKLASEFGRRRSPERAAVHFQLAQVAHAAGDLKQALEQLDKASSMDLGHPGILKMSGDLAREAGQLDRAERSYRALLLLVRRQASEGHELSVGVSEVLYELSRLATERKQDAQAKELLESAFETASQSTAEAARFTRTLVARGATDLALRTIDMRIAAETDVASRARTLVDRAEIQEKLLGKPEDALGSRLEALELAPGRAASEATRDLAARTGQVTRFVERVRALADRMRRKEDAEVVSDLLMTLGEVTERELRDLATASELYQRVEDLGARTLDAWRALARVASARGDHVEEIRVLRRLVAAGVDTSSFGAEDSIPEDAKVEAFYRIAEVELAEAETLESGIATLSEALAKRPDHARGARILNAAARSFPAHDGVLVLYERAARGSGDAALLLDMLEIKTAREGATIEEVREAIDVATSIDGARAEALLRRGIEVARASADGLAGQLWIPIALASRRLEAGDVTGALEWRRVAAEAAEESGDVDRARSLWREVAEAASQPGGDLALAAATYRRLLESEPNDRALWGPLAEVHGKLRDRAGFDAAIAALLDALLDPSARNELRMAHAAFLLDIVSAEQDGVDVLRAVLDEDPDHLGAAQRLADLFERDGRHEELAELLQRQLDRARDRSDTVAIAALALRMGGLLESAGRREDARDLYRQGLEWAPEDAPLLRAMLTLHGEGDDSHDRAALMERLLAVSTGESAATLALELADVYALLEDGEGVGRALDLGFRAMPSSDALRARLEAWHSDRGDLAGLADTIAFDAAHRSDTSAAVARFREAATLYTQRLDMPERAADILRQAQQLSPSSLTVLGELVAALLACGRPDEAAADVGGALEAHVEADASRAHLLRMRATLRLQSGEGDGAIVDLEEAYTIDPRSTYAELIDALERRRREVDRDSERPLTMRLASVLQENGDPARSRDVLAEWADREPSDLEALRTLRVIDTVNGRFEEVVRHCARLVEIEQGEAQVEAVLALADAATRIGAPHEARPGLERVHHDQPSDGRVRDALRTMYEQSQAWAELAGILLADAAGTSDVEARWAALRRAGELLVYEVQDPARAIDPLREALSIKEDEQDVVVVLSDAMIGAGALAEAVELLQNAIGASRRRRSPALAMMQLRMARIAGLSGDQQTQLEWLKVALESDKTNGAIAAELAELAMALGDDGTAMNALKVVTLQKTPGPMSKAVAFLRQAQIAHRAGDHQKAVLWARRARIEDGELHEAEEFLRGIGES
ncbi:Membrane protein in colicin uptake-like protein [Sandaracinus amylolyticus]|uniref:Membrane protein in colicin uptake-like protein n=2 Tax=Sandaracinus amylolyticus TaxID=927083 RepID=A0A0F6YHT7_9BACT|nr:Membrane protein in colicin uptake-like protein [Sandaracinus amylolyticus]